ncbi:MAG: hypothetical protein MI975_01950 [Cytophagales bacterium]|nr:hypothetical protein [Cytophagales bacterium]
MKRLRGRFLPALAFLTMFNCDEVKELADVNFQTTLTKTLPVNVVSTNEMTTSVTLDATSDPEIMKYANNIKGYEITKLRFAIENYQTSIPDEIYFDGSMGFGKKTGSQPTSTCAINPLNVTHWAGTGDFEIDACTNIINDISEALASDNAVKIYLTGNFSKAPLLFDMKVTADVKVTANPL